MANEIYFRPAMPWCKIDNYPLWCKNKARNSTLKSYNYHSNIIQINSHIVHIIKNQ